MLFRSAKTLGISTEESDEYETLNGFLISRIDKIPKDSDRMEVLSHGFCFKILSVENKIIQKVSVRRLTDTPCQDPEKMIR